MYCATANPVQVLVAETTLGRGIVGVVDGGAPLGVETETDVADRRQLLRDIGYEAVTIGRAAWPRESQRA